MSSTHKCKSIDCRKSKQVYLGSLSFQCTKYSTLKRRRTMVVPKCSANLKLFCLSTHVIRTFSYLLLLLISFMTPRVAQKGWRDLSTNIFVLLTTSRHVEVDYLYISSGSGEILSLYKKSKLSPTATHLLRYDAPLPSQCSNLPPDLTFLQTAIRSHNHLEARGNDREAA